MLPLNNNPNSTVPQSTGGGNAGAQKGNPAYMKVLDTLQLFASKWYWFLLCLAIALGCCYFYLATTPPIYTRNASILIKNDLQSSTTSNMKFLDSNIDVNNELFTLKSPNIAEGAVRRLHLEVNCFAQGRFHEVAVYGTNLSVQILPQSLNDQDEAEFMFDLRPNGTFVMSKFSKNGKSVSGSVMGKVGKVIETPIGKIDVQKSVNYFSQEITLRVVRTSLTYAINRTVTGLSAKAAGDMSTIITLSYDDEDPQRAEDILSTIIAIYNEKWVEDCNQKANSTSKFIGERLEVIEEELGNVEDNISSFKSANLIPANSNDVASIYVGQASSATAQATELNNQMYMARYVRNYLTNPANKYTLIPANQGVNSPNISAQITEYNTLLLSRNNLLSASSLQNPLVQEKDLQLEELRNALIASVDNHIASLNVELRSAQSIRGQANSKIASSPSQSKYLLSVERQQKVKESLYLYQIGRAHV